jgi:hypothetical protein
MNSNTICCPSCKNESFKINITKLNKEKDRVLLLICLSCNQPAGIVKSEESIILMQTLYQSHNTDKGIV